MVLDPVSQFLVVGYAGLQILTAFLAFLIASLALERDALMPGSRQLKWMACFIVGGLLFFGQALFCLVKIDVVTPRMLRSEVFIQLAMCWMIFLMARRRVSTPRTLVYCCLFLFLFLTTTACWWLDNMPPSFSVMICWSLLLIILYSTPTTAFQMPPAFRLFLVLGVMESAVQFSGSRQVLDGPFLLSSLIQVGQYLFLAIALIFDQTCRYVSPRFERRRLRQCNANLAGYEQKLSDVKQAATDAETSVTRTVAAKMGTSELEAESVLSQALSSRYAH